MSIYSYAVLNISCFANFIKNKNEPGMRFREMSQIKNEPGTGFRELSGEKEHIHFQDDCDKIESNKEGGHSI